MCDYIMTIKVQETKKGQKFITLSVHIAEAMGLKKGDKVYWKFNSNFWELRKD